MKQLIDYIIESTKLPTEYFGSNGEKLKVTDGVIQFLLTEAPEYPYVQSTHRPLEYGNSLIFKFKSGSYAIISPVHGMGEIEQLIKSAFKGAKNIRSIEGKVKSDFPHRGTMRDDHVELKVSLYEITQQDIDWGMFDKMSKTIYITPTIAPYGVRSIDKPYVWDMFSR